MRFDAFMMKVSIDVIMKQKNCSAATQVGMTEKETAEWHLTYCF